MLFLHTSSIVMPGFDASLSLNMVMINGVHGCMGHMMGMHLAIRYLAVSENFVYSKIATAMAILVVKGVKDRMWSCPHFWYGCGVWIDRVFQPFDPYLIFFSRNHRAPLHTHEAELRWNDRTAKFDYWRVLYWTQLQKRLRRIQRRHLLRRKLPLSKVSVAEHGRKVSPPCPEEVTIGRVVAVVRVEQVYLVPDRWPSYRASTPMRS